MVAAALAIARERATFTFRRVPVTTAAVTRGPAFEAVYAPERSNRSNRVTDQGKRRPAAIDLKVREGSRVNKGDLLAVIDSPALRSRAREGAGLISGQPHNKEPPRPPSWPAEAQARAIEADLNTVRVDRVRTANW